MVNNVRKSESLSSEVRNWIQDLKNIEKTYEEKMNEIENFIQYVLNQEKMDPAILKKFDDDMYDFTNELHDLELLYEDIGGIEDDRIINVNPLLEKIRDARKFLLEEVKRYIKDYIKANHGSNNHEINEIIKNDVINMRKRYAKNFKAIQNSISETCEILEKNIDRMQKI
ncbi:MAG: hypothetical protein ACXQS8_09380 [Candidatus Helarchaeales archaeon]